MCRENAPPPGNSRESAEENCWEHEVTVWQGQRYSVKGHRWVEGPVCEQLLVMISAGPGALSFDCGILGPYHGRKHLIYVTTCEPPVCQNQSGLAFASSLPLLPPRDSLGGKSGILSDRAVLLFRCKHLGIFPLLWTLVPRESGARTPPLRIVKGAREV